MVGTVEAPTILRGPRQLAETLDEEFPQAHLLALSSAQDLRLHVRGLVRRKPGNREKSPSFECSTA